MFTFTCHDRVRRRGRRRWRRRLRLGAGGRLHAIFHASLGRRRRAILHLLEVHRNDLLALQIVGPLVAKNQIKSRGFLGIGNVYDRRKNPLSKKYKNVKKRSPKFVKIVTPKSSRGILVLAVSRIARETRMNMGQSKSVCSSLKFVSVIWCECIASELSE